MHLWIFVCPSLFSVRHRRGAASGERRPAPLHSFSFTTRIICAIATAHDYGFYYFFLSILFPVFFVPFSSPDFSFSSSFSQFLFSGSTIDEAPSSPPRLRGASTSMGASLVIFSTLVSVTPHLFFSILAKLFIGFFFATKNSYDHVLQYGARVHSPSQAAADNRQVFSQFLSQYVDSSFYVVAIRETTRH